MSVHGIKSICNKHQGRSFLVYCPGKNILEWKDKVSSFIKDENLITIGSNKLMELVDLNYHMFTNNDKYEAYGGMVRDHSTLLLGSHILKKHIKKHKPQDYVRVNYTDTDPSESMKYNRKLDRIEGYYRTSGNLAIMLCHLMGASSIYVAGMSGFTWNFDGNVHYYKPEITRDVKTKKTWRKRYDKPVAKSLNNMVKFGIKFSIITPTIYDKHYDGSVLG